MSETFKNAEGRRVVSVDTAEELGEVKHLIVDRTANRIDSIHVTGKGTSAEVVRWSAVSAFGDDAVVTSEGEVAEQVTAGRDAEMTTGNITMLGSRILNTSGIEEGQVEDVVFEPKSGELLAVITANGQIEVERLRSLGSYALIVESD